MSTERVYRNSDWICYRHISTHREHAPMFGCVRLICTRHMGWIGWELCIVRLYYYQLWLILDFRTIQSSVIVEPVTVQCNGAVDGQSIALDMRLHVLVWAALQRRTLCRSVLIDRANALFGTAFAHGASPSGATSVGLTVQLCT